VKFILLTAFSSTDTRDMTYIVLKAPFNSNQPSSTDTPEAPLLLDSL